MMSESLVLFDGDPRKKGGIQSRIQFNSRERKRDDKRGEIVECCDEQEA
jgi:hypothetical protein